MPSQLVSKKRKASALSQLVSKKRKASALSKSTDSPREQREEPIAGLSNAVTDSRFTVDETFDEDEPIGEEEIETDEGNDALDPLSAAALLEYKAKADRTGIIYISRIPPGMGPSQVRHLLSQYGELGRVYLKRDEKGVLQPVVAVLMHTDAPPSKRQKQKHKAHRFVEGWVEFSDKKIARSVAEMLNAAQIGGKKGSRWRDDIWTMKYLPRYKWHMLSEHIGIFILTHESQVQAALLRSHLSQSKRDQANYLEQVERARVQGKKDAKRQAKALEAGESAAAPKPVSKKQRSFAQRTVVEPKATAGTSAALQGVLDSLF